MKLIREPIRMATAMALAAVESGVDFGLSPTDLEFMRTDFEHTLAIATHGQTVLFSSDQALDLRPALERFSEEVTFRLPFECLILQFDRAIPESEFFAAEAVQSVEHAMETLAALEEVGGGLFDTEGLRRGYDSVAALLLSQHEDGQGMWNQAIAFFSSTAVNRVAWRGDTVTYDPESKVARDSDVARNKQQLRALAMACIAYINCANMQLKRVATPEKVNRKRAGKGKKPLEPYYVVELRPEYASQAGELGGAGDRHVSYRFDVRGHFRRLSDGRLIWVRPHQRGLAHERYIPSVRRVEQEHGR